MLKKDTTRLLASYRLWHRALLRQCFTSTAKQLVAEKDFWGSHTSNYHHYKTLILHLIFVKAIRGCAGLATRSSATACRFSHAHNSWALLHLTFTMGLMWLRYPELNSDSVKRHCCTFFQHASSCSGMPWHMSDTLNQSLQINWRHTCGLLMACLLLLIR